MREKPKHKNKPSRLWKRILISAVLLMLLFTCLLMYQLYKGISQIDVFLEGVSVISEGDEAISDSLSYADIAIPDNSSDVFFYYYGWQDYNAHVRFSLLANEFDEWLEKSGLCFDLPLDGTYFSNTDITSISWWQPDEAQTYTIGEQCGSNPYFNIFIDQTNPDIWIIYIETFTV